MKFESKYAKFKTLKLIWKCHLQIVRQFFSDRLRETGRPRFSLWWNHMQDIYSEMLWSGRARPFFNLSRNGSIEQITHKGPFYEDILNHFWAQILHTVITVTSLWGRWRLKSPASRLFTQPFIQVQIKQNIKTRCHWPLYGEFTGDRRIPRKKV